MIAMPGFARSAFVGEDLSSIASPDDFDPPAPMQC